MQPHLTVDTQRFLYIPMRDGTELAADLYIPKRKGAYPGILLRTPYGKEGVNQEDIAARGYAVLAVDARATGASQGTYSYYNMADGMYDGYDLVEWLAKQEFCNGRIATKGGSALGIYQILTAWAQPPHLVCMCCSAYPLDFYRDQWYPGGVLRLQNRLNWIAGIRGRTSPEAAINAASTEADSAPDAEARRRSVYVQRYRRLELARRSGEDPDAWARLYLDTPMRSSCWDHIDLTPLMQKIQIPVLHSAVYYDHFGIGTMRGFRVHPGPKRLVIDPGSHGFRGNEQALTGLEEQWLDFWLKGFGAESDALGPAIFAYATGAERWIPLEEIPETRPLTYGLDTDGNLVTGNGEGQVQLTCDSADPAPSSRTDDHTDFESHPDVLVFTAKAFKEETMVFGRPELRLRVATEMPDANLIGRICAVDETGKSRQLNFGAQKLSLRHDLAQASPVPSGEWIDVSVKFWTVSHVFQPGTRLRITLSLSDFPFFESPPHAGALALDCRSSQLRLPSL